MSAGSVFAFQKIGEGTAARTTVEEPGFSPASRPIKTGALAPVSLFITANYFADAAIFFTMAITNLRSLSFNAGE